jgi:hypothetical protein
MMSGNIADDLAKLELAAAAIRQCRIETMRAGDSTGAEIGNLLQEALGQNDPRFGDVWRLITEAEQKLDDYSFLMLSAVEQIERIRGAMSNQM